MSGCPFSMKNHFTTSVTLILTHFICCNVNAIIKVCLNHSILLLTHPRNYDHYTLIKAKQTLTLTV